MMYRILQNRGQSGCLEFNHKVSPPLCADRQDPACRVVGVLTLCGDAWQAKTLHMIVQKDNTDESTQSNNVKELSGGERSFATLSLLLALGESIECPFRGPSLGGRAMLLDAC
jgi:ubiquinone/menaquinone biosynthesis C-methylase UbiE